MVGWVFIFITGGNAPKAGAPPSSYDKPWRKGMVSDAPPAQGGRQNPGGGANGQPADKKKYNGPDPDLAVQLERDMVRDCEKIIVFGSNEHIGDCTGCHVCLPPCPPIIDGRQPQHPLDRHCGARRGQACA